MGELQTFRDETRRWLLDNAPESLRGTRRSPFEGYWGGRRAVFASDDERRWLEVNIARGWTAPSWPRAYGGGGLDLAEARVLHEEMVALALPPPLVGFGLTMIGPILLVEGSETQKRTHLSRICSGEIRWCQGYSEPQAGSDLASLACRAVRDGDTLVVNGQKIWTSHADKSDWMFALVRTNPDVIKQAGITFLLLDMASPGVTTRPVQLISGASPFCETFFDSVSVPMDQVVGSIDDGWRVAKALLRHERTMVGESVAAGGARPPELQDVTLRGLAATYLEWENGRLADGVLRDRIAQLEMERACMSLTLQRSNDRLQAGEPPGPESSIFKVVGTEMNQRRWALASEIAGQGALGWEGPGFSDVELALTRMWLRSRGNTIEGGSTEIQLNIIARRVLELPR